ncbi:hypothetical protein F5Y16DRAFT_392214 [Xylariaceae sp. FL0255]|nr:hypothetical protein F5Y16DRAFT_392214 [Xylariaceae sp. FL0255]
MKSASTILSVVLSLLIYKKVRTCRGSRVLCNLVSRNLGTSCIAERTAIKDYSSIHHLVLECHVFWSDIFMKSVKICGFTYLSRQSPRSSYESVKKLVLGITSS